MQNEHWRKPASGDSLPEWNENTAHFTAPRKRKMYLSWGWGLLKKKTNLKA